MGCKIKRGIRRSLRKYWPIKIISINKPELVEHERHKSIEKTRAKCFGAQDGTERLALYKLNGEYYYSGFHLLKYKKSWKIDGLYSSLAGTSPGEAVKIDVFHYQGLIKPEWGAKNLICSGLSPIGQFITDFSHL